MDFSSKSPKKEFNKDIASKIEAPIYIQFFASKINESQYWGIFK